MLIDAEANGHRFQEMHVDGGVTAPVLTLPEAFLLRNGAPARGLRMNIYVLVNDKVERDYQLVPNSTIDIAARAGGFWTKAPPADDLLQSRIRYRRSATLDREANCLEPSQSRVKEFEPLKY